MTHILITGSNGQLGRALQEAAQKEHPSMRLTCMDMDTLDITRGESVSRVFHADPPDFVINCAAYTAVDKAESEPDTARAINAAGVKHLALAATRHNARMIHISTDYVFDGKGCLPYPTEHPTSPLSVYGQSKLEGEVEALYHAPGVVIVRTSWLYHKGGNNFVNTIIRHATVKKSLQVVNDQCGSPTRASDLAGALLRIIDNPPPKTLSTIYHFSNSGTATWYDFACAIVKQAGIQCAIEPIPTASLNLPAPRPAYSVLDCSAIRKDYSFSIPWWQDALDEYLNHQLPNPSV